MLSIQMYWAGECARPKITRQRLCLADVEMVYPHSVLIYDREKYNMILEQMRSI